MRTPSGLIVSRRRWRHGSGVALAWLESFGVDRVRREHSGKGPNHRANPTEQRPAEQQVERGDGGKVVVAAGRGDQCRRHVGHEDHHAEKRHF